MARTIKLDFDVSVTGAQQATSKFKDLNESITDSSRGLKDFTTGIKTLDFEAIASGADEAAKSMGSLSSSLRGAAALTNPYIAGAAAIATVLGGWAVAQYKVAEGSVKLAKELKNLQREFGVTEAQAAQLMRTTKALAEGFGQDVEKVGESVMALVNSAGAAIEEATGAVEKWGVILSKANFEKFTDSLNEFSGGMRDVGFSVEQTADVLGVLANNSQDTGRFLGAMFEAFNRLREPSETLNAQLIRFGLGDVSQALRSGAITGKDAFDRVSKAIIEAKKNGEDTSVIMAELGDTFSEMGSKSLEFYNQAVSGSNRLSRAQRDLLAASKELADAQTMRALKGKENIDIMQQEEAATLRLMAAWENFLTAFENSSFFKNITSFFTNIREGAAGLLNSVSKDIERRGIIEKNKEARKEYEAYINLVNRGQLTKNEAEDMSAAWWAKWGKKLPKTGDKKEETKKGGGKTSSVGESPTQSPVILEASALQEAESRLRKHLVTVQGLIEIASTEAKITKEEAALQSIQAEQKHHEEVVALATKLQGTTAVIDGETVKYKKLTTEELRDIEVKREEFRVKIRVAELEKEIAHQKHLLRIFETNQAKKLEALKGLLAKEQHLLDMRYEAGEISFYKHMMESQKLRTDAIHLEIEAEKIRHSEAMASQTATQQEKEESQAEHNRKMGALYEKLAQQERENQAERQRKIIELKKEYLKILEELQDRQMQITASGSGLFMGGIFDNAVQATKDLYRLKKEVVSLQEEIQKLQIALEDAIKVKDGEMANAIAANLNIKKAMLNQVIKEIITTRITTVIESMRVAVKEIFNLIDEAMQTEIDMLDRQLEKRKEILSTMQEQYNTEEARLKTMLEIDAIRAEDRQRELDDLGQNIPEAQKAALEQEKEKERERSEMRANAIKLNIAQEKQRLKEVEGSTRILENRKLEMQEKQFETKRVADIADAVMNGLTGQVKLWANPGFPLAIPLSAILAGVTIASVAKIASQKNPYTQRFAKGTLNVTGGEYGKDSVPALLMPGESVIPTETNNLYKDTIRAVYTRRIPHKVLNKIVNDYVNNSNSGTVFAVKGDNTDIVEAIKNKPVSVVKIDEDGFRDYIIKTNDDYNVLRKKLGL